MAGQPTVVMVSPFYLFKFVLVTHQTFNKQTSIFEYTPKPPLTPCSWLFLHQDAWSGSGRQTLGLVMPLIVTCESVSESMSL